MIHVDGRVAAPEELTQRVAALAGALRAGGRGADVLGLAGETDPPREVHLNRMQQLQAEMDPPAVERGRGLRQLVAATARRGVSRAVRWYIDPRLEAQRDHNGEVWSFLAGRNHDFVTLATEVAGLRRQVGDLKLQLFAALERVSSLLPQSSVAADGPRGSDAQRADLQALRRDVAALMERLGVSGLYGADVDYVAFEDRFRGDSEQVRASQERYLALIPPTGGRVVDIGCGRGEMLELLIGAGFDAIGVDSDAGMIATCEGKALPVRLTDGLSFLEGQAPASVAAILCNQVVEHLTTAELQRLIRLAHRVLREGGVLVMETINPRSSFALGNHFYADTSHTRPVHPETLRFICEQSGFSTVTLEERSLHPLAAELERLPDDAVGEAVTALLRTVFGYQDYFIAANK